MQELGQQPRCVQTLMWGGAPDFCCCGGGVWAAERFAPCPPPAAGSDCNQAARVLTPCTSGTRLPPHCSLDATATLCQWAIFLSARSPDKRNTLRSVIRGWMLVTPSSVAFSTSQSIRSLAGMPTARCTRGPASRSTAVCAPTRTCTSLRPMWVMVASNSPPRLVQASSSANSPWRPLNRVMLSPGCRRSTCTWRAAPAGRSSTASVAKGQGQ